MMVTVNAKKGSHHFSGKLEWLCLRRRQAGGRPQSPVKWESVGTGQGWTLQCSSSVEWTHRECERPGTAKGSRQNQPVCTSSVLWEPVRSTTNKPAELLSTKLVSTIPLAVYQQILDELFFIALKYTVAFTTQEQKYWEYVSCDLLEIILYYDFWSHRMPFLCFVSLNF